MTSATATNQLLFPPDVRTWADKLYVFGLFVFAFACSFSISASQIGLGLALIGCIGMYKQGSLKIEATTIGAPFAFLAITGFFSVFQAEDTFKAFSEMKSFLIIIVFYLAYWPPMRRELQQQLLFTLIFSAALVALINNFQIFTGVVEGKHTRGFYSMCITFGECMALAGITTLLCFANNKLGRKVSLLLLIALGLILSGVVFSFTRGAWLGFIAGSLLLTIRFPRRIAPLLFIVAVAAGIAVMQNDDLRERFSGFNLQKTMKAASKPISSEFETIALYSNLQRLYIWTRGFLMLENNFAFGVGQRNVKIHYTRMASHFEANNGLIYGHQHNNFMQMLAMNGFIGLIAFFYLLITIGKFTLGKPVPADHQNNDQLSLGTIAVFTCFVVFGFTEYVWGDQEVIMMAFFIIGLLMNNRTKDQSSTRDDGLPLADSQ